MSRVKSFIKQYFVLVILLFLIILFGILSPDSFLTMSNMFTIVRQSSIMGIATIGLLFVMVAGGIDLSLSSVISLQSVLVAVLLTSFGWGLFQADALAAEQGLFIERKEFIDNLQIKQEIITVRECRNQKVLVNKVRYALSE